MKKIFLLLMFIIFCSTSFGQKMIYDDFGEWSISNGTNKITIGAYITYEKVIRINKANMSYGSTSKNLKGEVVLEKNEEEYYRYELYLVSKSVYNNDTTSTWIYGGKIFVNGVEVTKDQFPEGFVISVATKPTFIYSYEAPIETDEVNISITWEEAIYEPRIRR